MNVQLVPPCFQRIESQGLSLLLYFVTVLCANLMFVLAASAKILPMGKYLTVKIFKSATLVEISRNSLWKQKLSPSGDGVLSESFFFSESEMHYLQNTSIRIHISPTTTISTNFKNRISIYQIASTVQNGKTDHKFITYLLPHKAIT